MNYSKINNFYLSAREGDQDAKLALVQALNPLIISSIKRYCPLWKYYEDLLQDGIVILLQAIKDHNPDKGRFLNYVKLYLKYYYLDTFKYLIEKDRETALDHEDLDLLNILEDSSNIEEEFLSKARSQSLLKALSCLSKRQRQVLLLYYYKNMSLEQIANYLGIKRWTVVNTKRRGIEILRGMKNEY